MSTGLFSPLEEGMEIIRSHNFAPGKAGVILYTDTVLPLIGFALLWLQHRYSRERSTAPSKRAETPAST